MTIKVHCKKCDRDIDEDDVIEVDNIESNELGQDVVTFKCPVCGNTSTSMRFGR